MKTWEEIHKPIFEHTMMVDLKEFIKKERETKSILPEPSKVMNAFKLTPYDSVRWVILGNDPYPDPAYCDGLAYSCPNENTPGSLANIFNEITKSLYITPEGEQNIEVYRKQIFKSNSLIPWAKQGILLLNTILTVEEGKPMSHAEKGWQLFTQRILSSLNDHPNPIVFMFWGEETQKWHPFVNNKKHLKLFTSHPGPKTVMNGFDGCGHFVEATRFIRDDYVNLRSHVNFATLIPDIKAIGKEKNITFDTELIERLPLFTFLKDVENKTIIKLALE